MQRAMNDLKFACRQLLKNPGFTPMAAVIPENADRTPDDRRSTPRSIRLRAAAPPRGSSKSIAQPMLADHSAIAPDVDLDGMGFREICDRQGERLLECRAAVPCTVARKLACLGKSRLAVKLFARGFHECRWIAPILRCRIVEKRAQGRTRARVLHNPFPGRITVQLRKKSRQIRDELCALGRRQTLDGGFDFLYRTHSQKLRDRRSVGKPSYTRRRSAHGLFAVGQQTL
jgi:hypothetical protein